MKTPWDWASVNWNRSAAGRNWLVPGCGGKADRGDYKAASILIPVGEDFRVSIDLTDALDRMAQGYEPDAGLLLTVADEFTDLVQFSTENDRSLVRRPRLHLTSFYSGLGSFRYAFDPRQRDTGWARGSVKRYRIEGGDINLTPGACLVTKNNDYKRGVIRGEVRITRGAGSAELSLKHARFGRYAVIFGPRCGLVRDPGGGRRKEQLWAAEAADLSDWLPFEISAGGGALFVRMGGAVSGPLEADLKKTDITIKAHDSYVTFRDLVMAPARASLEKR